MQAPRYKTAWRAAGALLALLGTITVITAIAVVARGGPRRTAPRSVVDVDVAPSRSDHLSYASWLSRQQMMVDGHNDLAWEMRVRGARDFAQLPLDADQEGVLQTDVARLAAGGLGGQFWSVYVPCSAQGLDAVRVQLEQIDIVHRMAKRYPETFRVATTVHEAREAFAAGRIASFLGMEGGHAIDSSLEALRMFFRLGVRYMTLTHTCDTPWATASTSAPEGGLSEYGRTVVREMNRMGMLVDLSHVSVQTMRDALEESTAPVIFSHSSARALCDHARNVPDDILALVAENGGVVMVNSYPPFVTCSDSATLSDVADHIDHIRDTIGAEHIGLGADFDGIEIVSEGLEDVSKYVDLIAELIRRGYSDDDLALIMGENVLRALHTAEQVAASEYTTFPSVDFLAPADHYSPGNVTRCQSNR